MTAGAQQVSDAAAQDARRSFFIVEPLAIWLVISQPRMAGNGLRNMNPVNHFEKSISPRGRLTNENSALDGQARSRCLKSERKI
jgi:hypothetical protein